MIACIQSSNHTNTWLALIHSPLGHQFIICRNDCNLSQMKNWLHGQSVETGKACGIKDTNLATALN